MRIGSVVLCFFLMSSALQAQTNQAPTEPPVFDKKFWTATGIMLGSTVVMAETAVRQQQDGRMERRLKMYTAAGISDFIIFAVSANAKSDEKKWWWVLPIATAAINGTFTIKYIKKF